MNLPMRVFLLALFGCLLSPCPAAMASFINLGPAGDFNVFVFNDNTQSGSDAQGRVAVGNDALFGQFTVASSMGSSTDNLIVGGNMSNNFNTLNGGLLVMGNASWNIPSITGRVAVNGDATFSGGGGTVGSPVLVGGAYSAPGYFPPNTFAEPAVLPFDFGQVATYLTDLSDTLAALPSNGVTTFAANNITMTGVDPAYNSFDVTAAQLAAGTGLTIAAPVGSTAVVNVHGAMAEFDNQGIFLVGVDKQRVLYNFPDATTLDIAGIGILGSLLAPRADVEFGFGNIDGTLIANNLTGPGESHLFPFLGELPRPIPEPGAASLALAAVTLAPRRRRR